MNDTLYFRRALQLARRGELDAAPNPMVGAVIVDNAGKIAGEGWHRKYGEAHAEVNAVNEARKNGVTDFTDKTIYVTLEPCAHFGKTPPCARLLAELKFKKVVIGMTDPNPKVAGKGIQILRDAGIDVKQASEEIYKECYRLNRKFLHSCQSERPYITLKWAQRASGTPRREIQQFIRVKGDKIISPDIDKIKGQISSPVTAALMHRERALNEAILVGSGTVIADDPKLDARLYSGREPLRVVLDRRGRIPATTKVFRDNNVAYFTDKKRADLPEEIQIIGAENPFLELRRRGITSVLVEGGAEILKYLIDNDLWDEARVETLYEQK